MDLEEFVKTSLVNIAKGVRSANDGLRKEGRNDSEKGWAAFSLGNQVPDRIVFDIALVATRETESGGRGGLKIAWIDVGGGKTTTAASEVTSRIKFGVDILYRID